MLLVPREHGAYGQMAVPLVTALAIAGVAPPAVLTTVAVVMGFLAHEPLLVLVGLRGDRARREAGAAARRWLAVAATLAAGAGVLALWMTPPGSRWAFALPLAPAAALTAAVVGGREKSGWAEACVSLAFSLAAVPVCMAAGAPVTTGFSVAVPFAVVFVAATLAVRAVILGVRAGGDPRASRITRTGALIVALAGTCALAAAAAAGVLTWAPFAGTLPGAVIASGLALVPPPARRLRAVGWTLVATSMTTAAVLIVAI